MQERANDGATRRSFEHRHLGRRGSEPFLGGEPVPAHRVPAVGALGGEADVPRRPGRDRQRRARPLEREAAALVASEQVVELLDEGAQPVAPLARRPRREARRLVVLVRAGADADLEPPPGHVVDGERLLREYARRAEHDRADDRADPDPARRLRERGERRPALVEGPRPDRVHEVVGHPEAVEPELLDLARPPDDLLPRLEGDDDRAESHGLHSPRDQALALASRFIPQEQEA